MNTLNVKIEVSPELYTKHPDSSELGRQIISKSIEMIKELGFEAFTFKKLGAQIGSNESSIYRYFENKHTLLVYLTSWYWTWIEYRLVFTNSNISSPHERLKNAIDILTKPVLVDNKNSYLNEMWLSEIVFSESIKAYHTKEVDAENKKGYFKAYKNVVLRVSQIVLEIKPDFEFAHMLISTVIEGAHQQKYFAKHLPTLTDGIKQTDSITNFYQELVFNFLNK